MRTHEQARTPSPRRLVEEAIKPHVEEIATLAAQGIFAAQALASIQRSMRPNGAPRRQNRRRESRQRAGGDLPRAASAHTNVARGNFFVVSSDISTVDLTMWSG